MTGRFEVSGVPDAEGLFVEALPDHLADATAHSAFWQARPGVLLLRVPHVGAFRMTDGRTLEVCPEQDADPAALDLCLYGAARAALLHQRGELPLHASSLVPPGGETAVALCGDSGAGKSTLSVELTRRGWTLVADDTTRVQWRNGRPMAWPSDRGVKLWSDACQTFNIPTAELRHVRQDMEKFYVEVPTRSDPVTLTTVLELLPGIGGLHRIASLPQRMSLLSRHAFRAGQVTALQVQAAHARIVAQVATACSVGQLSGARIVPVAELADRVEEAMAWQTN